MSKLSLLLRALALATLLSNSTAVAEEQADAPADAPADAAASPSDEEAALTTEIWREPSPSLDLHWNLLALPERAVELAFLPVAALVTTFEHYRLDKRIYDLLRNDAGTIQLVPNFKISFGDGLGAGATLKFRSREAHERRVAISALSRLNGDYEVGIKSRRKLIRADGRRLEARFDHEVDRNLPFYGIGNAAELTDQRALRSEYVEGAFSYELNKRGALDLTGLLEVGYRREKLSAGDDPGVVPVGLPGDLVATPAGFGVSSDFLTAQAEMRYDTRDAVGRPSRGFVAELHGSVAQEVDDRNLSAGAGTLNVTALVPLLPDRRVLALSLGMRAITPLASGDEVPLHELTTLGRTHHLRGYDRGRYRDRHGWWASAEYSFPIYEYTNTGVALDASLFFDTGRVASDLDALFGGEIRYAGGFGLRAAHDVLSIFRLDVGWSPEGAEIGFSVGKFD